MSLVLGIDGGGSKTHAVLADTEGSVWGFATNGPSNWEWVGLRGAGDSLREALAKALNGSGADVSEIVASAFGLAGVDWPSDVERLESVIGPLGVPGPRIIVNDAYVALRAGVVPPWGVVVVAGTGTVAAGRNPAGETHRTLGLGWRLGDWGSASDVSEEAVRAVADAFVGRGPQTVLTELLCSLTGARSAAEFLEEFSRGGEQIQNAAPTVLRAADDGDEAAREIVLASGRALGASANVVAARLGMVEAGYDLVLSGGLFRGRSSLLETAIAEAAPGSHLVPLTTPPAGGATLMALELAGVEVDADLHRRVCSGVEQCFS